MIVKMIENLENRMEKMQESINKDLEELKNKHTETKNTTTEIKNTLEGINVLLQRIFPTQGLNLGLLHCRQMLYRLSHQGSQISFIPKPGCSHYALSLGVEGLKTRQLRIREVL